MHVWFSIGPTPDESLHCSCNQLVAPPGNRSTFDVTYLGALTDKWLGWAPLRDKLCIHNKHSKQLLHGWKLLPVALMFISVALLLLLLAGNMANSSPSKPLIVAALHGQLIYPGCENISQNRLIFLLTGDKITTLIHSSCVEREKLPAIQPSPLQWFQKPTCMVSHVFMYTYWIYKGVDTLSLLRQ